MKTPFIIIVLLVTLSTTAFSQSINWRALKSNDKHIVNVNVGWDYSANAGFGYGYKIKSRLPLVANAEISLPAGEILLDDFKTKLGVQAEVFRYRNFSATVRAQAIFRRYESDFARLVNFGSEFSAVVGYFNTRWHVATEFGFDKSIITHIRHSHIIEENYPDAQSGWYLPTGGNFSLGLRAGYSFNSVDVTVSAGKMVAQDLKSQPMIPYYARLGINKRF